jgi:tetratricopeptide (TPR) repeat protein
MVFSFGQVCAQDRVNALERKYKKAERLYKKGEQKKADKLFLEIINSHPKYADIYSKIGRFYYDKYRFQDAAYYFEMGSKSVINGKKDFALPLANSYFRAGHYERASQALRNFSPIAANPQLAKEVQQLQQAIDFSKLVGYNTHNVTIENLRWPVNSELDDYAPSFSAIKRDLIFTRKSNGIDDDFFSADLDTCDLWDYPIDLGMPLNSHFPESYQTRSYSGKYMIYQKCDNRSENGWARGGCDLFLAYKTMEGWSEPKSFGYTINTTHFEGMPSLSADEKALYFVSDRPDGYGGLDIWVSYFENGRWTAPKNLGPNINTKGDDITPSIAADGKTLFFSSNGRPGMGGQDIYFSKLQADSSWSLATNLGSPINTAYDELAGSITLNGTHMFLTSNRPGGFGGLDIYKAQIPKPFLPKPMAILFGAIRDFETHNIITSTTIDIAALDANGEDLTLKGNKGDGTFYAILPHPSSYVVHIQHRYYKDFTDTLTLNKGIDSVDYKLFALDYVAAQQKQVVFNIPLDSIFKLEDEENVCLQVNEALQPYSGKMLGLSVEFYSDKTDAASIEEISNTLMQCFFKMGISEGYVQFVHWTNKGAILLSESQKQKMETLEVNVLYLNDSKQ